MNQRNMAASVRARLLKRARETRQDFNLILTRYALERLLYRLSISPHADQFLLKGALLFDLWFDIPHRRDTRRRSAGPRHSRDPACRGGVPGHLRGGTGRRHTLPA
ncbi:nucleotidyl transferase AbiEii/AbiGii toxin family protein [Ectothiorhodospira mobilis]|uniref:nucleotidyl transferase AbiEii/AbiGii toxin family protein n=1 Tax=Ectothiorhodospira mobilis TaxID=195064 RepID=UPI001EE9A221|nr:nucleotidyl transferase AbiEii/AbiGii toxin family protein [Ectothiorhodospira mobilis]MCG5535815.1 nucleotidyl transferase AbiEii/AbiGii toxin family protein [Ectothiorhodospira mobilis]